MKSARNTHPKLVKWALHDGVRDLNVVAHIENEPLSTRPTTAATPPARRPTRHTAATSSSSYTTAGAAWWTPRSAYPGPHSNQTGDDGGRTGQGQDPQGAKRNYDIVPFFAMEHTGPLRNEARCFVRLIAAEMAETTGSPGDRSHTAAQLHQRVSAACQRGYAADC